MVSAASARETVAQNATSCRDGGGVAGEVPMTRLNLEPWERGISRTVEGAGSNPLRPVVRGMLFLFAHRVSHS